MKKKRSRKKAVPAPIKPSKRDRRITFQVNEAEYDALCVYCQRYRIRNRSNFIRKTIFSQVSQRFVDDYPSLF